MKKYISDANKSISLNNLEIKLCQVEAKNPNFCPNQILFRPNDYVATIRFRAAGLVKSS